MRTYGAGDPLVFTHIPKTAGNNLREALKVVLRPATFAGGFDTSLFGGYDDVDEASATVRPNIRLRPEDLPADADFVSGHIAPWTTMQRYPGADHITVLRVGQVRLLSQWLHSRSVSNFDIRHWGRAGDVFRVGWGPLRAYLEHELLAPTVDNTITRFLAWPHPLLERTAFIPVEHDDELVGAATERVDAMAHVNVAENPDHLAEIGAWLGADLPKTQLNERTSVPASRRPDLAAELAGDTRELLDHRHRLDTRVWQHVSARMLPHPDPDAQVRQIVDAAIIRYGKVLEHPHQVRMRRRVVEGAYDLRQRLRSGRRSSEM